MKPHDLVASFAAAVSRDDPMGAARAALEELKSHIAEIDEALRCISGVGGNARQVFHRLRQRAFIVATTGRGSQRFRQEFESDLAAHMADERARAPLRRALTVNNG